MVDRCDDGFRMSCSRSIIVGAREGSCAVTKAICSGGAGIDGVSGGASPLVSMYELSGVNHDCSIPGGMLIDLRGTLYASG